jgi:astacin
MFDDHTPRRFRRRWWLLLAGMIAFALLAPRLAPTTEAPAPFAPLADADDSARYEQNVGASLATLDFTGMWGGQWFTKPLTVAYVDGVALFEGDIALSVDSLTMGGLGVNRKSLLWTGGVVAYDIDPALPAQNRVFDAIAHWEAKTTIRFVRRTAKNAAQYPNYVYFQPASGCWSYVGMVGGRQALGLALGCSTGSTIHEIGHVVGLWHEQSRADRDKFVKIHFENIVAGMEHNFTQHVADGQDLGKYDYDSIMHYPRWAFSKNGRDTIVPLQDVSIGQRTVLSEGDIEAVETMYRQK